LSLASQKIKLKEGIHDIYEMYRLYTLSEKLQEAEIVKDKQTVKAIITELSGLLVDIEENIPNSLPIVNYVKSKLMAYEVSSGAPDKLLELPLLPKPEGKTDLLINKAMNYLTVKNFPKALAYVNYVLKLEPNNGVAKGMLDEINRERRGKNIVRYSRADEHIAAAMASLEDMDYNEAQRQAQEALKLEPKNQDAFLMLQKAKLEAQKR